MSELLLIVGNSGAGKDWVAANRFANFTLYKLNQCFKDVFEKDHGLAPGTCNDKTKRNLPLLSGPLKNLTVQEAMVLSYQQSLNGSGYGAKFANVTVITALEALNTYSKTRTPIVITDLRKPAELEFLLLFAKLIKYTVRMICVVSDKEVPMASDKSLQMNITTFQALTHKKVEIYHNNY